MQATTVFLARVSKDGQFPFIPVAFKNGAPAAPANYTSFYARYSENGKRVVKPLGSELDAAYVAFLNLEAANKARRAGREVAVAPLAVPAGKTALTDAIEEYIVSSKAANDEETVETKTRILTSFNAVCSQHGVSTVEQIKEPRIGRRVLLEYINWMKENLPHQERDGVRRENTFHSRLRRIGAFLKHHDIKIKKSQNGGPSDPGLLYPNECPKYHGKPPKKFAQSTIQKMMEVATQDEKDLIQMFLYTGFRDAEIGYLEWDDIDFEANSVNVHAKTRTASRPWSWTPKDDESRPVDIPLPAFFIKQLKDRRKRYAAAKCCLVFPSGVCKPDEHLLRRVRAVAKRAGLPENTVELHKFRRTFACIVAAKRGIEMARQLLGHSDIQTTQGYLTADADDVQALRDSLDDLYSGYVGAAK